MLSAAVAVVSNVFNGVSSSELTPEQQLEETKRHDDYEEVRRMFNLNSFVPLFLKYKEKQIAVLFKHDTTESADLKKLADASRKQWNCGTCSRRSVAFAKFSSPSGPVAFSANFFENTRQYHSIDGEIYKAMADAAEAIATTPIVDLVIMRSTNLCHHPETAGGFTHWTLALDSKHKTDSIPSNQLDLIETAFHRYLPVDLPALVLKLVGDGSKVSIQNALDSLTVMERCIHAATYGDKWLAAFRWILAIIQDLKDKQMNPVQMDDRTKWSFYAQHLLNSGAISADDNKSAVCPFFHTVNNNIIDLLQCANSEKAMVTLITDRLNPSNYMRRDPNAVLSENEIKHAMEKLGDFTNTIMTHDEAKELPHAVMLRSHSPVVATSSSSADGFKQLLEGVKARSAENVAAAAAAAAATAASGAGGFAARTGNSTTALQVKGIATVDALLTYLQENDTAAVEIRTISLTPCYVAKTTLREGVLAFKHPWVFLNGNNPKRKLSLGDWAGVQLVLPLYKYTGQHRNVFFITKSDETKIDGKVSNCNLPEFLSSEYTRTCGKAFERLNTITNITIPEGPVAIGIGTSSVNEAGGLYTPIDLRINGTEVRISRLF